jgi:transcriptional regulator with XRE-family HTH domain
MRELRKGKALSQEELAFRCGLDRTYISLLERGLRVPTIVTLFKVSAALAIRPEEFITQMEVQNRES